MLATISQQFAFPFIGKGVRLFTQFLDNSEMSHGFHNREVLLIQSSGSGKSRLVTEATLTNLGILLNLRDAKGTPIVLVRFY